MNSVADSKVEANRRERIWFFPDKFWRATEHMKPEEVATLMAEVERCAEVRDVEALRKYPFVFVGDPYKNKKSA
jgi:hypothetical protein